MKIAIAASENQQKSGVDPHFAQSEWYCIFNTSSTEKWYTVNPGRYNGDDSGITAAKMLLEQKVQAVIAGRFGLKSVEFFRKNNIQMIIPNTEWTVEALIEKTRSIDNR
jgi:predicted Fe-Mo cluster-binding NifX family protein